MSYRYERRTIAELRAIATKVLQKFPKRRLGEFAIDIEGILEDLGLDVIYRPQLGAGVVGYAARDSKIIILSELQLVYLPRARFTIAEEVCHKILEWRLWEKPQIPAGAEAHELTERQHSDIESNAKALAAEILMPKAIFLGRFDHHHAAAAADGKTGDQLIKTAARSTAEDFIVSPMSAGLRSLKLELISNAEHRRCFPVLM